MKLLSRVSMALLTVPLVAMLWSSWWMIPFVQYDGTYRYEDLVHEAGFARFTVAVVALLIIFIPYRKGERWAVAALAVVILAYVVPVFLFRAIPNLGTWPIFRHMPEPRALGLRTVALVNFGVVTLSVAGLALAVLRLSKHATRGS